MLSEAVAAVHASRFEQRSIVLDTCVGLGLACDMSNLSCFAVLSFLWCVDATGTVTLYVRGCVRGCEVGVMRCACVCVWWLGCCCCVVTVPCRRRQSTSHLIDVDTEFCSEPELSPSRSLLLTPLNSPLSPIASTDSEVSTALVTLWHS